MSKVNLAQPPHELDLVIDFVNTLDIDAGTDALRTRDALAPWLTEKQLQEPSDRPLSDADHQRAITLREALRVLMLVNNGGTPSDDATRELEQTARRGDLGVHFGVGGSVSLAAAEEGVAGALARLLIPVAHALGDNSWQRVKACTAEDCEWAFYDHSRNRSGIWCDMAVCGNRKKVRTYRNRAPRDGR